MIYVYFISFTCFYVLIIATRQAMIRPLKGIHYLQISIYFLSGILLFLETYRFIETNIYNSYNTWFLTLCMSSIGFYLIPMIYLNFKYIVIGDNKSLQNSLPHFVAPLGFSVVIFLLIYEVDSIARYIESEKLSSSLLLAIQVVLVADWIAYNLAFLFELFTEYINRKNCPMLKMLVICSCAIGSFFCAIYSIVNLFLASTMPPYELFVFAVIINVTSLFVYTKDQKAVAASDAKQMPANRPVQLKNVDLDDVLEKIFELFNNEKIFCYEDLSMKGLAEELAISPHKLSEIFNRKLNRPFLQFVNEYRIKEACQYLVKEPDRTILSISNAVGYNSPSSFYSSFKNETGITPTEFRMKAREEIDIVT